MKSPKPRLSQVEKDQEGLRRCIAESKKLQAEAQEMVDRGREGGSGPEAKSARREVSPTPSG
jgi:hypothetical protein